MERYRDSPCLQTLSKRKEPVLDNQISLYTQKFPGQACKPLLWISNKQLLALQEYKSYVLTCTDGQDLFEEGWKIGRFVVACNEILTINSSKGFRPPSDYHLIQAVDPDFKVESLAQFDSVCHEVKEVNYLLVQTSKPFLVISHLDPYLETFQKELPKSDSARFLLLRDVAELDLVSDFCIEIDFERASEKVESLLKEANLVKPKDLFLVFISEFLATSIEIEFRFENPLLFLSKRYLGGTEEE